MKTTIRLAIVVMLTAVLTAFGGGGARAEHNGPFVYSDPGNLYGVQALYYTHNLGVGVDNVYPGQFSVRGVFRIRPINSQRIVITYQSLVTGAYYYTSCGGSGAVGNSIEIEGTSPC